MEDRNDIIVELASNYQTLAKASPVMPFSVPDSYFQGLTSQLIAPLIQDPQSIDFPLPAETVSEELQSISPILAKLQHQPSYQLPNHYFDQLQWTKPASKGKLTFFTMRQMKRMATYASAAVVAGFLLMGALLFSDHQPAQINLGLSDNQLPRIAELPVESLENYLHDQVNIETHDLQENAEWEVLDEWEESIGILSDQELEDYLNQQYPNH